MPDPVTSEWLALLRNTHEGLEKIIKAGGTFTDPDLAEKARQQLASRIEELERALDERPK